MMMRAARRQGAIGMRTALGARTAATTTATADKVDHLGSYDTTFANNRLELGDNSRNYNYMLMAGSKMLYMTAARLALIRVVASMSASLDVLAMASMELEIGNIAPGTTVTVKWRGKPVFVRHRTQEEIDAALSVPVETLVDKQTDGERHVGPAHWLVVLGVCTHLGCVPLPGQGDYKGWFCPCHGSHYDTSGRIRKGPAPLNLEVPEYSFLTDTLLKLG